MKLFETDWDAPGGAKQVEVDYPDAIIQGFVNWMRTTKRWLDDPEMLERRFRKMNSELAESRQRPRPIAAPATTSTPSTEPTTAQKRAAGLQKARDAKAAKKAAAGAV